MVRRSSSDDLEYNFHFVLPKKHSRVSLTVDPQPQQQQLLHPEVVTDLTDPSQELVIQDGLQQFVNREDEEQAIAPLPEMLQQEPTVEEEEPEVPVGLPQVQDEQQGREERAVAPIPEMLQQEPAVEEEEPEVPVGLPQVQDEQQVFNREDDERTVAPLPEMLQQEPAVKEEEPEVPVGLPQVQDEQQGREERAVAPIPEMLQQEPAVKEEEPEVPVGRVLVQDERQFVNREDVAPLPEMFQQEEPEVPVDRPLVQEHLQLVNHDDDDMAPIPQQILLEQHEVVLPQWYHPQCLGEIHQLGFDPVYIWREPHGGATVIEDPAQYDKIIIY